MSLCVQGFDSVETQRVWVHIAYALGFGDTHRWTQYSIRCETVLKNMRAYSKI